MESLNLNTLVSSLPTAQQNAEKDLLNDFKAAALSITTLYRSSRQNSKRAYNVGYATACQDLLMMIQQGVSVGGMHESNSYHADDTEGGMTIGRVMDWIEARIEAIKSREEEEEDEDEERERQADRRSGNHGPKTESTKSKALASAVPPSQKAKETASLSSPVPIVTLLPQESSSPSPPLSASVLRHVTRTHKARGVQPSSVLPNSQSSAINLIHDSSSQNSFSDSSFSIGAGAKRRHAMMMFLDSSSTPMTIGSSSATHSPPTSPGSVSGVYNGNPVHSASIRRRTRPLRNIPHQPQQNQNFNVIQPVSEAMDEDGDVRERKRVARRS